MKQVKLFIYNITLYVYKMCVCAQSYLTFCDPMDYSPPGSSGDFILGFPRQEYWSRGWELEWGSQEVGVAIKGQNGSLQ